MNVKDVRDNSLNYIQDMFPTVYDFRMEQFEKDVNSNWIVVVSFLVKNINTVEPKGIMGLSASSPTNLPYERIFKTLMLSPNGELKKVTMYKG